MESKIIFEQGHDTISLPKNYLCAWVTINRLNFVVKYLGRGFRFVFSLIKVTRGFGFRNRIISLQLQYIEEFILDRYAIG